MNVIFSSLSTIRTTKKRYLVRDKEVILLLHGDVVSCSQTCDALRIYEPWDTCFYNCTKCNTRIKLCGELQAKFLVNFMGYERHTR